MSALRGIVVNTTVKKSHEALEQSRNSLADAKSLGISNTPKAQAAASAEKLLESELKPLRQAQSQNSKLFYPNSTSEHDRSRPTLIPMDYQSVDDFTKALVRDHITQLSSSITNMVVDLVASINGNKFNKPHKIKNHYRSLIISIDDQQHQRFVELLSEAGFKFESGSNAVVVPKDISHIKKWADSEQLPHLIRNLIDKQHELATQDGLCKDNPEPAVKATSYLTETLEKLKKSNKSEGMSSRIQDAEYQRWP